MMGREPIQIIEIEQPFCSLEYGVSPCQAALGTTGEIKCFNTARTCQDLANFAPQPQILRFCRPMDKVPDGIHVIPSVQSASTTPTEINVVGGSKSKSPLGTRATLSVTFQDHPYSDVLVDKYRDERSYIATERGTFWSKFLARNPYYNSNIIRIKDGYVGQSLSEMSTRTYLIESIDGPDSGGRVRLKAKDILKLADNDKAQAPAASPGELIVDYADDVGIAELRVTRASASDYDSTGYVRVNDEVLHYGGITTISNTEIRLTGISRAVKGTTVDSHDAGDRVQQCLELSNIRPDHIAHKLLTEYGNVPSQYIPLSEWEAEAEVWLEPFRLTALITEPTGVTDLLAEITEQAMFYIWWDERDQEIKLKALRAAYTDPVVEWNDTNNVIADSYSARVKPQERISQVWVFFGQRDPTEKLDEETNYSRVRIRADAAAESDQQYGEKRIKKIYSRWLVSDSQALQVTVRLLARFRDNPRYVTVRLDAKDRATWTAALADLTVDDIVDETGAPKLERWQVIGAEEIVPGHTVQYTLQKFEYGATFRFAYITPNGMPAFADASDNQKDFGCWFSEADGTMPDGSAPYVFH